MASAATVSKSSATPEQAARLTRGTLAEGVLPGLLRELYVGRKCCPLALPPAPQILEAETLADAFRGYERLYPPIVKKDICPAFWDEHPSHGMDEIGEFERLDVSLGHRRFTSRKERAGSFLLRRPS